MGIGSTVKGMFTDNPNAPLSKDAGNIVSSRSDAPYDSGLTTDPSQVGSSVRTRQKLPSGTGVGTTGKRAAAETSAASDAQRVSQHGISGIGTDAAAAHGGSLSETHQGSAPRRGGGGGGGFGTGIRDARADISSSGSGSNATHQRSATIGGVRDIDSAPRTTTNVNARSRTLNVPITNSPEVVDTSSSAVTSRPAGGILDTHTFGHNKINSTELNPSGNNTYEDTNQLNPVTHERVRHIETEEVERVKDLHRHIHHVQHHIQPITASEELAEQVRDNVHPVTNIREKHANKAEDNVLFNNQIKQQRDTMEHLPTERRIIDKGTTVNEHVHHHIHHIIQPVIQKETLDKQRIRTTIPIHEVTNEAPVVHQSQTHAAVPIEHFVNRGGALNGAVSHDQITGKVLHSGHCTRDVDGVADHLSRNLGLSEQTTGTGTAGTRTVGEKVGGDISASTGVPDSATHTHVPSVDMRTAHRPVHVAETPAEQPVSVVAT